MNRFTFFINIDGLGDNAQEAWEDAMGRLAEALMGSGEYAKAPGTIYGKDDPIPAADLLSGEPFQEFGIDQGEEE